MKRSGPPERRTRLRRRGRKAAVRFAEDFGPQATRCRAMPCCACLAEGIPQPSPTEPHHEPPRSLGGTDHDTLPLCGYHHRLRHSLSPARFWARLNLDPSEVLERVRSGSVTPGDQYDAIPY